MLWALGRLQAFDRLVSVVHARAPRSPAVAAWHEGFHALADELLMTGFRTAGVAEADLVAAARIGTFVVEGLLTHPQDEAGSRAVISLLARRLGPVGKRDAGLLG